MNLFYTEHVVPEDKPAQFILKGQEAVHAFRVLRVRAGDSLSATDGKGTIYSGTVAFSAKDRVQVDASESVVHPRPDPSVAIAVGNIRKRDRLEFAVEKAVEMGVSEVVVFQGDHSEKRKVRIDRMELAAFSAMKQSLRPWLPVVREYRDLRSVLKEYESVKRVVADEKKTEAVLDVVGWKREKKLLFIVAPEGGFSEKEANLIRADKAETISLGRYRLRTETAVIAVASLFVPGIPR